MGAVLTRQRRQITHSALLPAVRAICGIAWSVNFSCRTRIKRLNTIYCKFALIHFQHTYVAVIHRAIITVACHTIGGNNCCGCLVRDVRRQIEIELMVVVRLHIFLAVAVSRAALLYGKRIDI